eukprot:s3300_g3.t1
MAGRPSQWDGYYYKGGGKHKGHKHGKWKEQPWEASQFPTFEMMQPAARPDSSSSQQPTDVIMIEDAASGASEYVKRVQKVLNGFRKTESKARRLESDKEDLEAKWVEFQKGLRKAFLADRTKYMDKMDKLNQDAAENQKQKEEAIQELQMILSRPSEALKPKETEADAPAFAELEKLLTPQASGLASMLASAMRTSDLTSEDKRQQILKAIDEHRKQARAPTTPPSRRSTFPVVTPPATTPAPAAMETEDGCQGYSAGEPGKTILDPYMTSPSLAGMMPTAASRAPALQKLSSAADQDCRPEASGTWRAARPGGGRQVGGRARATEANVISDEDDMVGDLTNTIREEPGPPEDE